MKEKDGGGKEIREESNEENIRNYAKSKAGKFNNVKESWRETWRQINRIKLKNMGKKKKKKKKIKKNACKECHNSTFPHNPPSQIPNDFYAYSVQREPQALLNYLTILTESSD